MKNQMMVWALVCFFSSKGLASADEKGVNVFVCPDGIPGEVRVETVDVQEARDLSGLKPSLGPIDEPWTQKVDTLLARAKEISAFGAGVMLKAYEKFSDETQFLGGLELRLIEDPGLLSIPANCQVKQLSLSDDGDQRIGMKYRFQKELWESLDEDNKAIAVFQLLLQESRIRIHNNQDLHLLDPSALRRLNGLIFSDKAAQVSRLRLGRLIGRAGLNWMMDFGGFMGFTEDLHAPVSGDEPGIFRLSVRTVSGRSGLRVGNDTLLIKRAYYDETRDRILWIEIEDHVLMRIQFLGTVVSLRGSVEIAENGDPSSFTIVGPASVTFNGKNLTLNGQVSLHDLDHPSSFTLEKGETYRTEGGYLCDVESTYGGPQILLDKRGSVRQCELSGKIVAIQGSFDGAYFEGRAEFHPDGGLKKSKLAQPAWIVVQGKKVLFSAMPIQFHPGHRVRLGDISQPTELKLRDGRTALFKGLVSFDEEGLVLP